MTHKAKLTIIAILSCCALFSVGFAGWVITQSESAYVTGRISADDVKDSSYYIAYSSASGLDYLSGGFKDHPDDKPYEATLSITYTVYPDNIRKLLGNRSTVKAEITLGFFNVLPSDYQYNIFATQYVTGAVASADMIEGESTSSTTGDVCKLSFDLKLSSEATSQQLTVTFNFNLNDQNTYTNYIYNVLYEQKNSLVFNARIGD